MSRDERTNDYCIKEGYLARSFNATLDANRPEPYWSKKKVVASWVYQYQVYAYARNLFKQHRLKNYVIDVGCGFGLKLNVLIGGVTDKYIGIDQEFPIRYCREHYKNGVYYVDDLENPSVEIDHKADLIICADVIEHVSDPDILLNYIKMIAHGDSLIVLSTPERDLLRGQDCMASEKTEHVREWNTLEFRSYIEQSGFRIFEQGLYSPLRLSIRSFREYMRLLMRQKLKGLKFNYNLVVLCKLAQGR